MGPEKFFTSYNLEKYPNDGKLPKCKKCIALGVDNWDPETYTWILKEIDVPYIPDEWSKLMMKYAKDPSKVTGNTILGRYLSKMRLKNFKEFRWKDSEFLQQMADSKREQAMKQSGYDAQQIAIALSQPAYQIPEKPPEVEEPEVDYFDQQNGIELPEEDLELTDEDKLYLRMKWGKTYKPEEWVALEQLYDDMINSYDIQGAGHKDTLKLVCKTSLKANQLIDIGDVEGFQKMSKVYDSLMKSGKFTAAQNKQDSNEFVDSIGELIEMCERDGYIERLYVESPKDKVDLTILDMQRYTKRLIEEETNLTTLVEKAIRDNEREDEESANNVENEIVDDAELSLEELEQSIKDSEYSDFEQFKEDEAALDEEYLTGGEE